MQNKITKRLTIEFDPSKTIEQTIAELVVEPERIAEADAANKKDIDDAIDRTPDYAEIAARGFRTTINYQMTVSRAVMYKEKDGTEGVYTQRYLAVIDIIGVPEDLTKAA